MVRFCNASNVIKTVGCTLLGLLAVSSSTTSAANTPTVEMAVRSGTKSEGALLLEEKIRTIDWGNRRRVSNYVQQLSNETK